MPKNIKPASMRRGFKFTVSLTMLNMNGCTIHSITCDNLIQTIMPDKITVTGKKQKKKRSPAVLNEILFKTKKKGQPCDQGSSN